MSLYEVLRVFLMKIQREMVKERAESVAYNLTLATFPFIIFLFTLIPYIPIGELSESFFIEIERLFPVSVAAEINRTIRGILSKQQTSLRSFSFLTAMYLAANGMNAFITAFNASYHIEDKRNFFLKRLLALLMTVLLFLVLSLTILLIVSGELILGTLLSFQILDDNVLFHAINLMRYVVVAVSFFVSVLFMYYFAPAVRLPLRQHLLGAFLATVLIMVFSVLFSYYITAFNTYNKIYGSIGTLLIYMVWILAVSWVILLGFELNISIVQARSTKKNT